VAYLSTVTLDGLRSAGETVVPGSAPYEVGATLTRSGADSQMSAGGVLLFLFLIGYIVMSGAVND
jgi:hypothetical protein